MSRLLAAQPDPAAVSALLDREVVVAALLLELQFSSGTVRISNVGGDVVDGGPGHTWHGLGDLVSMTDFDGDQDTLAPLREYVLGIPWEFLSEVDSVPSQALQRIPGLIGAPAEYRGRPAILSMQLFDVDAVDPHGRPRAVGVPIVFDTGTMTNVGWSFARDSVKVTLKAEGILSRKGAPVYGMLTERDQKRRFPTDKFMDFADEVVVTKVKWTDW